jgi:hypothetical protein
VSEIGPIDPQSNVPKYIFIKLDKYTGPKFCLRSDIPIRMYTWLEYCPKTQLSWTRTNYPVALSFGITLHRSVGSSLSKAVIHIPENSLLNRQRPNLFFVGLSRVRTLKDILLADKFRPQIVQTRRVPAWVDEEKRLRELQANKRIKLEPT